MDWLIKAGQLSGSAMHVAVCLAYQAGLKRSWTMKFPYKRCADMGLSHAVVRRAILQLEAAGLVTIQKSPGCAHTVTLVGAGVPRRLRANVGGE